MSEWDDAVLDVNEAVMDLYAGPHTYVHVLGNGTTVEYAIDGVLDEMHLEEQVTPGRYCRFMMPVDMLPFPPTTGDQIRLGASTYDVTEVIADQYQSYILMLRKAGA